MGGLFKVGGVDATVSPSSQPSVSVRAGHQPQDHFRTSSGNSGSQVIGSLVNSRGVLEAQASQILQHKEHVEGPQEPVGVPRPGGRVRIRRDDVTTTTTTPPPTDRCDLVGPIGGYTFDPAGYTTMTSQIFRNTAGRALLNEWKSTCLGQMGPINAGDLSGLNEVQQRQILDFVFKKETTTQFFSDFKASNLLQSPYENFRDSSSCTELAELRLSDSDVSLMITNAEWISQFPALSGVSDPGVVLLMSRFRQSLPTEVLYSTAFSDLIGYLSEPQNREVVNFLLKQPQECLVDQQSEAARAAAQGVVVDPSCSATPINGTAAVLPDRFASARLDVRITNLAKSINAIALLITSTQGVDVIDLPQLFKDINANATDTASLNFALKYAQEKLGACLGEPYFNFDAVTLPAPVTWTTVSTFFNANKPQLFPVFATLAGSPGLEPTFATFSNLTSTSPNITDAEAETLVNMLERMGYTVPNIQPPPTTTVDPNATTPASSPAPSRSGDSALLPGVLGGVAGALLLTLLAVVLVMRARRPKPLPFLEGVTRFAPSPHIDSVRTPLLLTRPENPKTVVVVTVQGKKHVSIHNAQNSKQPSYTEVDSEEAANSRTQFLNLDTHVVSMETLAPERTLVPSSLTVVHPIRIDGVNVLEEVPLLSLLVLSSLFPKLFLSDSTSPTASASSVPQLPQDSFSIRVEVPTRKDLHVLLNLVSALDSVDTANQKMIYDVSVTQEGLDRVAQYCRHDKALQQPGLDLQAILTHLEPNGDSVTRNPELSFLILARVLQCYSGIALESIQPLSDQALADALHSFATKASEAWSTHWPSSPGVTSKHSPLTKNEYSILKRLLSKFDYEFGFPGLFNDSITDSPQHYSHYTLEQPQVFFEKQGDPGYLIFNGRELTVAQLLAHASSVEGFRDLVISTPREELFDQANFHAAGTSQHAVVISGGTTNTVLFVTEALFNAAFAAAVPVHQVMMNAYGSPYSAGESGSPVHFSHPFVVPDLNENQLGPYELNAPVSPFSELPVLEERYGFTSRRASSLSYEGGSFGFGESPPSSPLQSPRHSIHVASSAASQPPSSLSSNDPSTTEEQAPAGSELRHSFSTAEAEAARKQLQSQVKGQTVTVFSASSTLPATPSVSGRKTYLSSDSLDRLVALEVNSKRVEGASTVQHLKEFLTIFFEGAPSEDSNLTLRDLFKKLVKDSILKEYPPDSDAKKQALQIYARQRGFITAEEIIKKNQTYGFDTVAPAAGYDFDGSGSISVLESTSIRQGYVAKTNAMLQKIKFTRQQGGNPVSVHNMEDLTVAEFFSLQFMFRQIQHHSAEIVEETKF
jgi:hypothetical protein